MAARLKAFRNHAVGFLKRFTDRANLDLHGLHDIVAPLLVDERRVRGERLLHVPDCIQSLVLDINQVSGVFGSVAISGNNNGNRLTHKAHFFPSQDRPVAGLMRRSLTRLVLDPKRLNRVGDVGSG